MQQRADEEVTDKEGEGEDEESGSEGGENDKAGLAKEKERHLCTIAEHQQGNFTQ